MDNYSLFIIVSRILFYLLDESLSHVIITSSYVVDVIYNKSNATMCYNNILTLIVLLFFGQNNQMKEIIVWMELGTLIYHLFTPNNKIVAVFLMYYKIIGFHFKFANILFQNTFSYLLFTITNLIWLSNVWVSSGLIDIIINNPVLYKTPTLKIYWRSIIMGLAYASFLGIVQILVPINSYYFLGAFLLLSFITWLFVEEPVLLHKPSYGGTVGCGLLGFYQFGFAFLDKFCLAFLIFEIIKRFGCLSYGCCYGKPTGSNFYLRYKNRDSYMLMMNPAKKNVPIYPLTWMGLLAFSFLSLIIFRQYLFSLQHSQGLIFGNTILVYSIISFAYEFLRGKHIKMDNFITNMCKIGILLGCVVIAICSSKVGTNKMEIYNGQIDPLPLCIIFLIATAVHI